GYARLARMDDLPRFVGQRGKIEKIRFITAQRIDRLLRMLGKPPGLGYLSRAGMLAARRAVHDQYPRRRLRVFLPLLRGLNFRPRFPPLDRQVVRRVGVALPGAGRARRLAVLDIAIPRDLANLLQLAMHLAEGGVVELREETLAELLLRQRNVLVLLPNRGLGHGSTLLWLLLDGHACDT